MNYFDTLQNRAQISILQVYDLETEHVEKIRRFDHVIEAPNWTHDGKKLIYNANGKLYQLELSSGYIEELQTGGADTCNNDHVLSPTDGRIGVSSGKNGDLLSKIYIIDPELGSSKLITPTEHSYLHGWSPDGKNLAFCGARVYAGRLEWDIYTIPAEGGREVRLTDAPGLNDGPEYSPDGTYIWFNSVRSGRMQIWRMRADGSEQTQMTFDECMNAWFPHVSPDGKNVVYLAYHVGDLAPGEHLPDKQVELRMIPTAGGAARRLFRFFGGQGSINVNSWSPDSRQFAFVSYEK